MKTLVASALLALSLVVCVCSYAQDHAPATSAALMSAESPESADDAQLLPSAPRQEAMVRPAAPVGVAVAPQVETREPKVIDKKFVTLGVLVFGTTSLDMELTQHCLQRNTCVELNPTLPTSHWGMYATNTPVNAAVMWLAYKRRQGGHRDWWIWPAIDAGVHVVGVGTNARFAFGHH